MTSGTDAAGTTSYTYDNADRLSTVADPLTGATLTYGYNADSLPGLDRLRHGRHGRARPSPSRYNGLQQLASDTLTSASGGDDRLGELRLRRRREPDLPDHRRAARRVVGHATATTRPTS